MHTKDIYRKYLNHKKKKKRNKKNQQKKKKKKNDGTNINQHSYN